jgi:hypothetical protein
MKLVWLSLYALASVIDFLALWLRDYAAEQIKGEPKEKS